MNSIDSKQYSQEVEDRETVPARNEINSAIIISERQQTHIRRKVPKSYVPKSYIKRFRVEANETFPF